MASEAPDQILLMSAMDYASSHGVSLEEAMAALTDAGPADAAESTEAGSVVAMSDAEPDAPAGPTGGIPAEGGGRRRRV